jgi:cytoskeleton protein RodZ
MTATIGQQLKNAREARELSLQDVEKSIHIRVHYLQALENDDFSSMPSKAQARGFLRLYADFLKIPSFHPIVADEAAGPGAEPSPEIPLESPVQVESHIDQVEIISETIPEGTNPTLQNPPPPPQAEEENLHRRKIAATQKGGSSSEPIQKSPELTYFALYREIGNQLRERRETLSLSLDDIALHTRIKREFLEIIEDGRLDDLPSPVQGRGMISNYAEFLDLDSDALLSRFADALQLKRLELLPPPPQGEKPSGDSTPQPTLLQKVSDFPAFKSISRILTPDLLIGGSLALLLVILVIWGAIQVINPVTPSPKATAPSISEILLTTPTYEQILEGTPGTGANTAIPNGSSVPEQPNSTSMAITLEGTPSFNQGSQPVQVYVIVNQGAFLKITEDGSVKFNGRVVPGNAYQFSGYNKVELLTGNGAALQIIFNETDLGILGDPGSVVKLVFSKDGFGTATPSQPVKPTSTRQPTLTIQPSVTPTVTPYVP